MINVFSYRVGHDFGLAPNPFGSYCTLAVCKSQIRRNKNLKVGDWVIGTRSAKLGALNELVFAMRVDEKLTFNEYWDDPRFQYKKPQLNGSLVKMYGDNFYHQHPVSGKWIQETSAHSQRDADEHKKRDTGGKFVLASKHYYYFGDQSPEVPDELNQIISNNPRSMVYEIIPLKIRRVFVEWLEANFEMGICGDPINWKEYLGVPPQN